LHAPDEGSLLERVKALAGDTSVEEIERFLEGFPRRYLAVHSAAEIAAHFALYRNWALISVQDRTPRHAPWILPDAAYGGPPGSLRDDFGRAGRLGHEH